MTVRLPRAWVEVDLGAVRRNAAALARLAAVPLVPMIKADAYGLGAVAVARALEPLAPWAYGVATVAEGEELRAAGITQRLLVTTPLLVEELAGARAADLTPVLGSADAVAAWTRTPRPWHLAIDTGMSRAGVRWDRVDALAGLLRAAPPEGAMTHFHSAELDDGSVDEQTDRFEAALARLPARPPLLHAENSAAIARQGRSPWSLVRPGIFLYGVSSGPTARVHPEPVAALRARVVEVREIGPGETVSYDATYRASGARRIATLNIGYADGYRRAWSGRGEAVVRGRRAPVAGLVTMDMTMLDVTEAPCDVGDVATLIGSDGGDCVSLETAAARAALSPYEVLVGLRLRTERVYRDTEP